MVNNDVTKMVFMRPDPALMTVDLADLAQKHKKLIEEREKANPPARVPAEVELKKLLNEVFILKQQVQDFDIYQLNIAGTVQLLEQRLEKALAEKKRYAEAGNLRAERNAEHIVQQLESELADAKKEYERAKRQSVGATRALRDYPHAARIVELKATLKTSLP